MRHGKGSTSVAIGVAALLSLGVASVATSQSPAPSGSAPAGSMAPLPVGSPNPALDALRANGLRVSYVNENPWSYADDQGNFTGAEGELIKDCGVRLGFDVLPILTQWDSQLPGLASNRWDAIVAGMATTPQRLEVAIATQPLYAYGARLLVEKGNPLNLHNWDDVAKAGQTVGMVSGGFYQDKVEAMGVTV